MDKAKRSGNKESMPTLQTRNLNEIRNKTGNVYESIVVIAKRANQVSLQVREELHSKLEEFASVTDNLEEIHENREQIEISKHYEKMPNASVIATDEFLDDKIYFRNPAKEDANSPAL